MNANDTAKTASLALGRSPYSKGAEKLAAALEKPMDSTPKSGWTADDCPDAYGHTTIRLSDGTIHGNTEERPIATVYGEDAANAKLIAAAPALLAEVESLRKTLADALDNMPYLFPAYGKTESMTTEAKAWREKLQAATKSARAALTLATGGAK